MAAFVYDVPSQLQPDGSYVISAPLDMVVIVRLYDLFLVKGLVEEESW